jgi:hypothetical protein
MIQLYVCVHAVYSVYTPMYEGLVVSNYTQVGLLYTSAAVQLIRFIGRHTWSKRLPILTTLLYPW